MFKSGNYLAAFQAYSLAIQHEPDNPVYYTNRAMAALKVGTPRCCISHTVGLSAAAGVTILQIVSHPG